MICFSGSELYSRWVPLHFHNKCYFISRYCMCLILPYIQSRCEKLRKVSTCIQCIISIVTNISPKRYIHIPRPRQKASNQSVNSENILLKRRVEVFDRVYLLFNLVTSNQSFFNLRHPINDEA